MKKSIKELQILLENKKYRNLELIEKLEIDIGNSQIEAMHDKLKNENDLIYDILMYCRRGEKFNLK